MSRFEGLASRSQRGRWLVASLAVAAMVSPMAAVSSAQAAVANPTPAVAPQSVAPQSVASVSLIRMSPSVAAPFQKVVVSGRLPNRRSRTLWVQRKVGNTWVSTGFKTRTTSSGYYAFKLYGSSSGTYTITVRMMAPRIVVRGRVQAQYVTGSRTLHVVARS